MEKEVMVAGAEIRHADLEVVAPVQQEQCQLSKDEIDKEVVVKEHQEQQEAGEVMKIARRWHQYQRMLILTKMTRTRILIMHQQAVEMTIC